MKGHHEMGTIGNAEIFWGDRDPLSDEAIDLLEQRNRIHDHSVPDYTKFPRPENAGGDEVQNVLHTFTDDSVSGIVSSLGADHHIGFLCEKIDDLPFSFIAPLGADHDGI
jgi:hypothetical protein